MRVLLLNTYDSGGAGTATRRIHEGLRRLGVDSRMLVQIKQGDDPLVEGPEGKTVRRAYSMARVVVDPLPLKLFGGADGEFSVGWLPDDIDKQVDERDPDVVHLNWIGEGFFNIKTVSEFDRPIVWRLPDMAAFTGGCHYASGCDKYQEACGSCPKLERNFAWDISRWTWKRKANSWESADITVVAPSTWLAQRARESSLFGDRRIEVIPNGLDTELYQPRDQELGRELFRLPTDSRLVLFGAHVTSDPRKGFHLLQEALDGLANEPEYGDVELVVFGSSEPENPPDLGFETHYTGYLHDDQSLALLYATADVMVVPSKYEGFGQTASEALSCGTPVVAFDATGPSDIVDHEENGYLAEPYDPQDLAEGISWVLDSQNQYLAENARRKAVDEYALETVANQYRGLYQEIAQ